MFIHLTDQLLGNLPLQGFVILATLFPLPFGPLLERLVRSKGDDIGGMAPGMSLRVFQRRKRQVITVAEFAAGQRGIVIVATVNPVVFAFDSQRCR